MWVGVGPIFESGARARAKIFIFYFFTNGTHHTIHKKRKSGSRDSGCARGPQVQNHTLFFCKVMVRALGLRPAQPGSAQLSPGQLISGSGELSAEG